MFDTQNVKYSEHMLLNCDNFNSTVTFTNYEYMYESLFTSQEQEQEFINDPDYDNKIIKYASYLRRTHYLIFLFNSGFISCNNRYNEQNEFNPIVNVVLIDGIYRTIAEYM